ncbi:MAG: pyridoxamine 5'-phosphate oxidase family protein, partial [Cyanobacteria bacterium P01_D01_bin.44]
LARSAFHHSMNYRSVVLFGTAQRVDDLAEKQTALQAFTEQVIPGRWASIRQPSPTELSGTTVLALPITEASAKVRTGPPIDDKADYDLPVWAGVIPLQLMAQTPVADPKLSGAIAPPASVQNYRRSG